MRRILPLFLSLLALAQADPIKVLAIGDSLTDEYGSVSDLADIPGFGAAVGGSIYPEPTPPSTNPRAFNWPELLTIRRPAEVTFGPSGSWSSFVGGSGGNGDLRLQGYEYNFAIVGTTTVNWLELVTTDSQFETPDDSFPFNFLYYRTREALLDTLPFMDVVVIMLGGNDLKNDYDSMFNDARPEPPPLNRVPQFLNLIHTFVRNNAPNIPIVVATVPDVGATPNIFDVYNDPAKQQATRAKIAAMNDEIAATMTAKANTAVARVDTLTSDILDIILGEVPGPYEINGTEFIIDGDPANPPQYLFCKDDFHPNTVAQALISNRIAAAVNELLPGSITPFSNREILDDLLALDPDQPYLDWAAGYTLSDDGPDADPDGDGLPNLVEMTLGLDPGSPSTAVEGEWPAGLSWTPVDTGYAELFAEESGDLSGWDEVPEERLSVSGGEVTATPPSGEEEHFLRLRAEPRP